MSKGKLKYEDLIGRSYEEMPCLFVCGEVLRRLGIDFREWKFVPVQKIDLRPGDIVLFKDFGEESRHVGVMVEQGKFLHSCSGVGVHRGCLSHPLYRNIIEAFYRYAG